MTIKSLRIGIFFRFFITSLFFFNLDYNKNNYNKFDKYINFLINETIININNNIDKTSFLQNTNSIILYNNYLLNNNYLKINKKNDHSYFFTEYSNIGTFIKNIYKINIQEAFPVLFINKYNNIEKERQFRFLCLKYLSKFILDFAKHIKKIIDKFKLNIEEFNFELFKNFLKENNPPFMLELCIKSNALSPLIKYFELFEKNISLIKKKFSYNQIYKTITQILKTSNNDNKIDTIFNLKYQLEQILWILIKNFNFYINNNLSTILKFIFHLDNKIFNLLIKIILSHSYYIDNKNLNYKIPKYLDIDNIKNENIFNIYSGINLHFDINAILNSICLWLILDVNNFYYISTAIYNELKNYFPSTFINIIKTIEKLVFDNNTFINAIIKFYYSYNFKKTLFKIRQNFIKIISNQKNLTNNIKHKLFLLLLEKFLFEINNLNNNISINKNNQKKIEDLFDIYKNINFNCYPKIKILKTQLNEVKNIHKNKFINFLNLSKKQYLLNDYHDFYFNIFENLFINNKNLKIEQNKIIKQKNNQKHNKLTKCITILLLFFATFSSYLFKWNFTIFWIYCLLPFLLLIFKPKQQQKINYIPWVNTLLKSFLQIIKANTNQRTFSKIIMLFKNYHTLTKKKEIIVLLIIIAIIYLIYFVKNIIYLSIILSLIFQFLAIIFNDYNKDPSSLLSNVIMFQKIQINFRFNIFNKITKFFEFNLNFYSSWITVIYTWIIIIYDLARIFLKILIFTKARDDLHEHNRIKILNFFSILINIFKLFITLLYLSKQNMLLKSKQNLILTIFIFITIFTLINSYSNLLENKILYDILELRYRNNN